MDRVGGIFRCIVWVGFLGGSCVGGWKNKGRTSKVKKCCNSIPTLSVLICLTAFLHNCILPAHESSVP